MYLLKLTTHRVAGSDTTSTAVQSTLLAIILNPHVYRTLKSEIHTMIEAKAVSYPIQDVETKRMPYLQACVLEGLRKFPPLTQLRERIVPPEGDTMKGQRIPGGTFIGFNAWGTQLNEIYGADPDVFRPERWLTSNETRLKEMLHTHGLIFGHGSTKCLGMAMAMMELHKMIFEVRLSLPGDASSNIHSSSGISTSRLPIHTSHGPVYAMAFSSKRILTYTSREQRLDRCSKVELFTELVRRISWAEERQRARQPSMRMAHLGSVSQMHR